MYVPIGNAWNLSLPVLSVCMSYWNGQGALSYTFAWSGQTKCTQCQQSSIVHDILLHKNTHNNMTLKWKV